MDKLTGYESWTPNSKVWGSGDLPLFQEAEFFQGPVEGVMGIQHYHINYNHNYYNINYNHPYHHINYNHIYINYNYNHLYHHINYNHLYHHINYNHLYHHINYTQHYHITCFMLERAIATMARVKEGTMGQGCTGEQTGEEDNVKTFTFQLVYQKEKGKGVTDNEEEEKKEEDEEKKDKDAENGTEPINTRNAGDSRAEVHGELCKSVTNSWEELVSADREELVGESSQPCSWKVNQKVICYITSESEDVSSTSDSVERGFEVTYMTPEVEVEYEEDSIELGNICYCEDERGATFFNSEAEHHEEEEEVLQVVAEYEDDSAKLGEAVAGAAHGRGRAGCGEPGGHPRAQHHTLLGGRSQASAEPHSPTAAGHSRNSIL